MSLSQVSNHARLAGLHAIIHSQRSTYTLPKPRAPASAARSSLTHYPVADRASHTQGVSLTKEQSSLQLRSITNILDPAISHGARVSPQGGPGLHRLRRFLDDGGVPLRALPPHRPDRGLPPLGGPHDRLPRDQPRRRLRLHRPPHPRPPLLHHGRRGLPQERRHVQAPRHAPGLEEPGRPRPPLPRLRRHSPRLRPLHQRHLLRRAHRVRPRARRRAQPPGQALPPGPRLQRQHRLQRHPHRQPAEPRHRLQQQDLLPQVPPRHPPRHARRHGRQHGHAALHVLEGPRGGLPRRGRGREADDLRRGRPLAVHHVPQKPAQEPAPAQRHHRQRRRRVHDGGEPLHQAPVVHAVHRGTPEALPQELRLHRHRGDGHRLHGRAQHVVDRHHHRHRARRRRLQGRRALFGEGVLLAARLLLRDVHHRQRVQQDRAAQRHLELHGPLLQGRQRRRHLRPLHHHPPALQPRLQRTNSAADGGRGGDRGGTDLPSSGDPVMATASVGEHGGGEPIAARIGCEPDRVRAGAPSPAQRL